MLSIFLRFCPIELMQMQQLPKFLDLGKQEHYVSQLI